MDADWAAETGEGLDEATMERGDGEDGDGSRKMAAKRVLTRTMAEWEETCKQLRLPSDSREFCDFVLVFDVLDQDDVTDAGCCSCFEPSAKEVQKCLDVRVSLFVFFFFNQSINQSEYLNSGLSGTATARSTDYRK